MKDKWNHVMSLPAFFHTEKATLKKPSDTTFSEHVQTFQDAFCRSCSKSEGRWVFLCGKQIHNWLHSSSYVEESIKGINGYAKPLDKSLDTSSNDVFFETQCNTF